MRISAQNNQFIFNLPYYVMEKQTEEEFEKLLDKNFIYYDSVVDYMNATIREVVVPSLSFNVVEQTLKRGKKRAFTESGNILDKYTNEIDITFRAVDSYLNYFMLQKMLTDFYLNTQIKHFDFIPLEILDKDGDLLYTILFEECIFKSISEIRLGYQQQDISEKTFTMTFRYNFLDIRWEIDDDDKDTSKSVFDVPTYYNPGKLDKDE